MLIIAAVFVGVEDVFEVVASVLGPRAAANGARHIHGVENFYLSQSHKYFFYAEKTVTVEVKFAW